MRHTIIHQYDPERHVAGGIDGFVRDVLKWGGPSRSIRVVGVTSPDDPRPLGRELEVAGPDGTLVRFIAVARLQAGDQNRSVPHSLRLVAGVMRHRLKFTHDIVHLHRADVAVGLNRSIAAARHRVQFIHGSAREALAHHAETMWRFAPQLSDRVERWAVEQAESTYVMHDESARRLAEVGSKVRTGRNWYDDSIFSPPIVRRASDALDLIWVGRLEPQKDPQLAIHVVKALRDGGLPVTLTLVGSGSLQAAVRSEIRAAAQEHAIDLAGPLSPQALAARMRQSALLLMTSRWEGIPRAAIEAMACGLPVVSTPAGDVPRLVAAGAGCVTSDRGVRVLAEAVRAVLAARIPPSVPARSVGALAASQVVPALLHEIESDAQAMP